MMTQTSNAQDAGILERLKSFRLLHTAQNWQAIAQAAAQENLSYRDFLDRILSDEDALRHARVVERLIREARFPVIKTMDSFDWSHPARIDKQMVLKALEFDFVKDKRNLIFLGPSGLGKSHLAIAIGYAACQREIRTLFTTAADMINHLVAAEATNSLEKALKKFISPELVVVDEVGYLPLGKQGRDIFYQVVSKRYETGSIVLSTNRPFKDWTEIFGDRTATVAIVDRLAHRAELIRIEGGSYRVKNRKAKLFGLEEPAETKK